VAEFLIDTTELRVLEQDVAVASVAAEKQVRDTVRKGAFEIQARGRVLCPVRTGHLRNSISVDFRGSNMHLAQAEIGPEANYGAFVELGTERQAPQPYMGPAFDAVEPSIIAGLESISPLGRTT